MRSWFRSLSSKRSFRPDYRSCPVVERLEDRRLLTASTTGANVLQTNLVSDLPGVAANLDPNLANPWGIIQPSPSAPYWIADNHSSLSTLYNNAGTPNALVVSIPSPSDPTGTTGAPTGVVFNTVANGGTGGFQITDGTHTAAATFLFVTEDGTIVGWNRNVDPTGTFNGPGGASTHAVIAKDNSGNGSIYKGMAIATDPSSGQTYLYVANFHNGNVNVFDTSFNKVTLSKDAFKDNTLPAGYAPFNVAAINGKIYVTYALQKPDKVDDQAGPHHGYIDVYNLDGSHRHRLVSGGALDSPWGMVIAPSGFGSLAGALLVGNFGNGHINAYNATTGASMGHLMDPDGEPIAIDGLWGLTVGSTGSGGGDSDVYFTAGLFDEAHGLFGELSPVAPGTPEGPAEAQMLQAFLDVYQMSLATVQQDLANGVTGQQLHDDLEALSKSARALNAATAAFVKDTRDDATTDGVTIDTQLAGPAHVYQHSTLDDLFSTLAGTALHQP